MSLLLCSSGVGRGEGGGEGAVVSDLNHSHNGGGRGGRGLLFLI